MKTENIIRYLLLLLCSMVILFPLLYALSISLMESGKPIGTKLIPTSVTFQNYIDVLNGPVLGFVINSFIFAGLITVGVLITSSLSAFAFSFITFKGKTLLFMLVMSTMMIPWEATIIPNYDTITDVGWLNTFPGLIVPHLALPLGIFLLRQHFLTFPMELYDASKIDGCSRFRFFLSIVMPLSKPILAALGTFSFITSWNQYLWPLLVTNDNSIRTVQIGLNMMIAQEEQNTFPLIMAGVITIIIPTLVILVIGHKYLQEGLASYSQK